MNILSSLRDQLFIIAGVESNLEAELVPAFFGDGVAKRVSLNGFCYGLFSSGHHLQDRLNSIRDLFKQVVDHLKESCILHFENLKKEIADKPFDLKEKTKAENRILQTCTYLNPFIKQFLKGLDLPYLKFLSEGQDPFLLFLRYAKIVQKTKNIEIITGLPVPFKVLLKVHACLKLNANESDVLKDWLQGLENSKSTLVANFTGDKNNPYTTGRWLHRYFSLLSMILFWNETTLEVELKKRGCKLFDDPDPEWIKIRQETKLGHSYLVEGKKYTIGKCIRNESNDPMLPMAFSILDCPGFELVIDHNESYGKTQQWLHEKTHYGVIMPQTIGRFRAISIVEKTFHPLDSITWSSGDDGLSDMDAIQAHPIVELLAGLSFQPCTPAPLSPALFAFNRNNEMRALQLMPKTGSMSFEALEEFVWACSLNPDRSINSAVFTYLMTASRLIQLPHVKFYQDLIKQALQDQEMEKAVSLDGSIKKSEILAYRKEFFLAIQAYKQEIKKEILSLYEVIDVKKLDERLVSAFQAIHLKSCPGRLFLPGFLKQCKHYVLLDLKPRMHPVRLFPIRRTLINTISQCKLGDWTVQAEWREEKKYHLYGIYNKSEREEIYYAGETVYKKEIK